MLEGAVDSFYAAVPVRRRLLRKTSVLGDDVPVAVLQPDSDDEPLSSLRDETPPSIVSRVGSEVVFAENQETLTYGTAQALYGGGPDSDPSSHEFGDEMMACAEAAYDENQDGQTGLVHLR
jgi:hypothetical protein